MKALSLFSGGLDSMLATKIVMDLGVEVLALNFISHFFGKTKQVFESAKAINVKLEFINFSPEHLKLIEQPQYGFGKNMNPCIDCHGLMLRKCNDLLESYKADFVITGEVLGQRPMSQTEKPLKIVHNLSDLNGLLLRPLSAKLLQPSIPEINGWVDREKLYGISGRGRKIQYELAEKYGIKNVPSPAGGCLLTDRNYSEKLKQIRKDNYLYDVALLEAMKFGRVFRIKECCYVVCGRNSYENNKLNNYYSKFAKLVIKDTSSNPGPTVLLFSEKVDDEIKEICMKIFLIFSRTRGLESTMIDINNKLEEQEIFDVNEFKSFLKTISI